jgi:hypothetical protein
MTDTERIVAFLREIGIGAEPAELGDDCFLPGVAVERGALRYDEARFSLGVYPGLGLLVEAGMTTAGAYPRMLRWLRA